MTAWQRNKQVFSLEKQVLNANELAVHNRRGWLIGWTTINLIWCLYLSFYWVFSKGLVFNAWCYKDLSLRLICGHPCAICLSACLLPLDLKWNLCLYESFSQHNSQRPLNYVQLLQLLQLAHTTLSPPVFPASDNYPSMSKSSEPDLRVSHHPPTPPSNHRMFNCTRRAHCLWLVAEKQHWGKKKKKPDKYSLQEKGSLQIVPRVNGFDE